ncbi:MULTISPECIES: hypothetical protein [unclassified Embleya]|uniref:hypothetical protein n=1 Tax=unclassified Embleya TaxID=2699296 RepID=UPI0033E044F3
MPDVSVDEKQRIKNLNARMANVDQNLSAECTVIAGGLGLLGLGPQAGAFAVGAGLFRLLASYRQSVANDPSRDDFDQVWISAAEVDESALPADEPVRSLHRAGAHVLVLSDQLWALLTAMERHEGAVGAGDTNAADTQADAVRRNANACASTQDALAGFGSDLNNIWATVHATNGFDWNGISVDDARQLFTASWGDPPASPEAPLQALIGCVTGTADDVLTPFADTGLSDPILGMTERPAEPTVLFDDGSATDLADLSAALRNLVTDSNA